jgi:hypothetical protein
MTTELHVAWHVNPRLEYTNRSLQHLLDVLAGEPRSVREYVWR